MRATGADRPSAPMCWACLRLRLDALHRAATGGDPVAGRLRGLVARGTTLLAVYAIGLGVPFLLVAAFLPRLGGVMGWMKRHMDRIERVMGLLLWTIGLLMLTGGFAAFSYWLLETFPALAYVG
jgi:hypothetical protein